jgi:hypothetical protein
MRIPKCKECEHLTEAKKYYPNIGIKIEQYCNYGGIPVRMGGYVLSPAWCPLRKEREGK